MRPHRWQPTRLPRPWDSPGKNTGVGCHFLLQSMKVKSEKSLSRVWLLATPWTAAHQAPPSMGFSRQEYWSGVPWLYNWLPFSIPGIIFFTNGNFLLFLYFPLSVFSVLSSDMCYSYTVPSAFMWVSLSISPVFSIFCLDRFPWLCFQITVLFLILSIPLVTSYTAAAAASRFSRVRLCATPQTGLGSV